jgi:hypothetical protein
VALELVDLAREADDMEAIVTGDVLHLALVLRPTTAEAPGEARLIVNGEVRARAPARADHRETVAALTRILEAAASTCGPATGSSPARWCRSRSSRATTWSPCSTALAGRRRGSPGLLPLVGHPQPEASVSEGERGAQRSGDDRPDGDPAP